MMKTNRRKNISALQLRSLAGRTPHERGSALLIVIGTLALVAVFAAVYVSIGRTDRRAAQTFRNRVEQQDKSFQFAEYLSGIIGDDRLDAYVQYDINGNPFARREVVDVVYTDWSRRSEVNLGVNSEEALLFTPTGRPYRMEGLTADTDFRVQNDPWLAATTPTFLGDPGYPDNPLGPIDDRPFGKLLPFDINRPNAGGYLDQRDWLQISNFAPDGRPVNLFNLRPNTSDFGVRGVNNGDVGGFDAEPGIGVSPRASDGRRIRRMSNYLSLLNVADPTDPQTFLRAFDPTTDGIWVAGYNTPIAGPDLGIPANEIANTPAVWTMNQRFMFMPMNQPFVILNRLGNESSWADPDYPAYQYADADGDGFADSRWFELRSARDLGAGDAFGSARDDIQDLFEQGDMRYFFAARAIDLSSMVNINTATDGLVTPSVAYPMGSSPAEIDLRRLLTMQDQAENYVAMTSTAGPNFLPLSLNAAPRPYAESEIIATPRVWDLATRPEEDFRRAPEDYQFYQADLPPSSTDLREPLANSPSMLIGRYAYSALRRAIRMGGTPGNQFRGFDLESGGSASSARDLIQFETMDPNSPTSMPITAQERYEQYIEIGRQYSANPGLITSSAGLFGIDDLSELLTFHGLNDPDFTSRLERVVDGRFESGTGDPIQTRRLSPLLSNRDLTLDRFGHTRILSTVDMRTAPYLDNLTDLTRIGEISRNSMALMALTPRKRMTTLSGFVPLSPDERLTDASELSALTVGSALPTLENLMQDPQALFGLYSGALAGEIEDMRGFGAWQSDPTLFANEEYSTLFYGHRGPELALRTAAHSAVNMKDIVDQDTDPTVATVIADSNQTPLDLQTYSANMTDTSLNPSSDLEYRRYPGIAEGNLFDAIDENVLSNLPDQRKAVNVYGIEATPIITEVSMLYAFTDSPGDVGLTQDYDASTDPRATLFNGQWIIRLPERSQAEKVRISGEVSQANSDYLMQVLAVQLHNPYDVPISLGGKKYSSTNPQPFAQNEALTRKYEYNGANSIDSNSIDTNSNYHFDYYLEYKGRFFKVAKYLEWYPTADTNAIESYASLDNPTTTVAYGTVNNPVDDGVSVLGDTITADVSSYPDFITRNVVLGPGETRVFYAIADQRFDDRNEVSPLDLSDGQNPDDRWRRYLSEWGELDPRFTAGPDRDGDGYFSGRDGRGWTGPAEEWVNRQLQVVDGTARYAPVMMMDFDPTTGQLFDNIGFQRLDLPTTGAYPLVVPSDRKNSDEVRLWKKIITPGEESDNPQYPNAIYENIMENDLLVDRMAVQNMTTDMPTGEVEIEDTWSFSEDYPIPGSREEELNARNDNKGITIADWITTRRMDSDTQNRPNPGEVMPWMVRSRFNTGLTEVLHREDDINTNISTDSSVLFQSGAADYESRLVARADYEITTTLGEFWEYTIQDEGGYAIIQTIALPPYAKSNVVTPFVGVVAIDDDGGNRSTEKFGDVNEFAVTIAGTAFDPAGPLPRAELLTRRQSFDDAKPRLSELLLAWGIGAAHAPDPSLPIQPGVPAYEPEEWMTITESLGLALGVDVITSTDLEPLAADSVWYEAWDPTAVEGLLDLGRLSLDRFVPFINDNTADTFFNPSVDRIRGAGVPAALGVLDRARVFEPLGRVTDPVANPPATLGLTRPTFGTININTAPVEVLRLLPGLTPSRAQYYNTNAGAGVAYEWWGNRLTDSEAADTSVLAAINAGNASTLLKNPDVAAGIVAYRDRVMAAPITGAHATAAADLYYSSPLNPGVNDDVNNLQSLADNFMTEDPFLYPGTTNITLDRRTMTGIEGLRMTPGFGSLGELLAVRLDPELEATNTQAWNNLRNLTMNLYAVDDLAQGLQDDATVVPQVYGDGAGSYSVGETVDDYAEQLAMASGVLNMVSVRSDYYAVWFVIQGYRESDVANLRPEDPLVPTLQKRFMMVVDRSNVIEPGDKPRIVLLKEVPL